MMAYPLGTITGKFDYAFFVNLESKGQKSVLEWCINMDLISKEYECPVCKMPMVLEERKENIDGFAWVCQQEGDNEHLVERSVRKGSFFDRSTLDITTILLMTYLWIKKATCEFIEDELNVPSATIMEWMNFCLEVCVNVCIRRNTAIGGDGLIVEINESKYKGKKCTFNDNVVGKWVYVGFEKETDKGFYEVVEERNEESLANVIKKYVLPGTVLVSECWKEYDCLENDCFIDLKDSLDIKFADLGVGVYGSSIIGMRRTIKRTYNNIKSLSNDFDLHFAEYMFRRTNSDNPYDLIPSFLKELSVIYPPNIKD